MSRLDLDNQAVDETTQSTCTLHIFPHEIRAHIFEDVIQDFFDHDWSRPGLIVFKHIIRPLGNGIITKLVEHPLELALTTEKRLYLEVLRIKLKSSLSKISQRWTGPYLYPTLGSRSPLLQSCMRRVEIDMQAISRHVGSLIPPNFLQFSYRTSRPCPRGGSTHTRDKLAPRRRKPTHHGIDPPILVEEGMEY
jgi:hypothetical protein